MKFKRAGENDVEKLIELIKGKFSALSKVAFSGKYSDLSEKATAADVGALPLTGGTLSRSEKAVLKLNNIADGGTGAEVYFLIKNNPTAILTGKQNGGFDFYDVVNRKVLLGFDDNKLTYKQQKIILEGELTPIGTVHISVNNVNPSTYFGGTWESMGTMQQSGTTCYMWKRTS